MVAVPAPQHATVCRYGDDYALFGRGITMIVQRPDGRCDDCGGTVVRSPNRRSEDYLSATDFRC